MSRTVSTPYIEWAKLSSSAPVSLAASGVPHASVTDLGITFEDVEIAGPSAYGYEPLVAAIAAKHGVAEDCVVTAAGTSMANHLAMAGLVAPGDHVVIERPTYEPMLGVLEYLGARVTRVDRQPAGGFALDADLVAAAITPATKLVVLANLHNPSSHLTSVETLSAIGVAAERVGARVLVDEVYLDAVFDAPQRSCVHLGPMFVSTNSLTKLYGVSGLRCGWILAEPALARRLWRLNDLFSSVPAFVAERLALRVFERLPLVLQRSRALLETNRQLVREFFSSRGDVRLTVPPYGTTVCFRPPDGRAEALWRHLRTRYDTSLVPGRFFEAPDHLRLGLCADPATTADGLSRLARALDDMVRGEVS